MWISLTSKLCPAAQGLRGIFAFRLRQNFLSEALVAPLGIFPNQTKIAPLPLDTCNVD